MDTPRYLDDPSADDIVKFARERAEYYQPQDADDEKYAAAYNKKSQLDVAGEAGDNIKAVSSGVAGQAVDQTLALINVKPWLTIFPTGETDTESSKVNEEWEPWLNKCFDRAATEDVNGQCNQDLVVFHRAWSVFVYDASAWADTPEYQTLLKAHQALVDDDKADEEETTKARKALERYKRDHFPLVWYHVPARKVWPMFSRKVWLPEVVEIREMTETDIEAEYPGKGEFSNPSSTTTHKVLVYANHRVMKTVLDGGSEPKVLHSFEHKMGCNPYSLRQMLHRPDDPRRPWRSVLDHNLDNITAFDTWLSDLLNFTRKFLRSGILLRSDSTVENEDPEVAGHTREWEIEIGKSYIIPQEAEPMTMPHPKIAPEFFSLGGVLKDRIDSASLQPQIQGDAKSGESATLFNTRFQISDKQYQGYMAAITADWTYLPKLVIRSLKALNDGAPSEADWDKVSVIDEKRGILSAGYKDLAPYENTIQPRTDRTLPINLNVKYAMANQAIALQLPLKYIWESILNIENPEQLRREKDLEMIRESLMQWVIQQTQARAGVLNAAAAQGQLGDIGSRLQALTDAGAPGFQQALMPQTPATPMPMTPPGVLQGNANLARTGVPQAPSQDVAANGMAPIA